MSSHSRKPSSRAALPRRTTRGPLDEEDPLSPSSTLTTPTAKSPAASILSQKKPGAENIGTTEIPSISPGTTPVETAEDEEEKDLSFLLDASIYHPLSQLEVPAPFRRPFRQINFATSTLSEVFTAIESLLSQLDYIGAAHVCGGLFTSGLLKPGDRRSIFRAIQIRYACLEISGNTLLAAQEAKALEDLGSAFYYLVPPPQDTTGANDVPNQRLPQHIMPFSLRLQALRLQSVGFSDPRRGVGSLYDLGLECREHIASPMTSEDDRRLWEQRLQEVGIRVVNALVEIGDLDCARRTLETLKPEAGESMSTWTFRKALLCLRIGLISDAKKLTNSLVMNEPDKLLLSALIAVADDRLGDAISVLKGANPSADKGLSTLVRQNAAVALLYKGKIREARALLETLIDDHTAFSSLTINLATIYDLSSDRSRELKVGLADRIGASRASGQVHAFTNADFKL